MSRTSLMGLLAALMGPMPQPLRDEASLGDICAYDLLPGAIATHKETGTAFFMAMVEEGKAVATNLANGKSAGEVVDVREVGPTKEFVGRLFSDILKYFPNTGWVVYPDYSAFLSDTLVEQGYTVTAPSEESFRVVGDRYRAAIQKYRTFGPSGRGDIVKVEPAQAVTIFPGSDDDLDGSC